MSKKHMRLPNGFGQISEIKSGNLRNRFRAMVTVGKNEKGRPIVKPLKPKSYFKTYNEAYKALVEYNNDPYKIDDTLSMNELYEKWSKEYFKKLGSPSSERTVKSAWSHCKSLYNLQVSAVRSRHLKECIDTGKSANMKNRMKSVLNLLFDYAVEYEYATKNYARAFSISESVTKEVSLNRKEHMPFTDLEMKLLWENIDKKQYVDVVLIQCYTGFRPQELGLLKVENIKDGFITGGMKTEAGTNRVVPIHSCIAGIIDKKIEEARDLGSEYLLNCSESDDKKMTYDKYKTRFKKVVSELGLNPLHRAHDGRMHFITMAKKYNVDEYAIKYIVGHKIQDITERVYTKRELTWLREEMEKIKENVGMV